MNFSLSDDHLALRDAAHNFLRRRVDLTPLLTPGAPPPDGYHDALWPDVRELGWPMMMVPEDFGGLGLTEIDLSMVLRECGRFLAPVPLFGTLAGTWALLAAASEEQKRRVLPRVAEGSVRLALAFAPASGDPDAALPEVQARHMEAGRYALTGTSHFVVDAAGANLFVVSALLDGLPRLFLVEAGRQGVEVQRLDWRDITRQVAHVRWAGAQGELLPVQWHAVWPWLRNRLYLVLAAESSGGLQAVLEDTAAYARERVAFGRPIGANQAIKHALADMLAQSECVSAAVLYAAWALAQDEPTATLGAAMAQSHASDAYRDATHRSIQVFGAIGFTWEMKNHLYFKRARGNATLLGEPRRQRELIAGILEQRSSFSPRLKETTT